MRSSRSGGPRLLLALLALLLPGAARAQEITDQRVLNALALEGQGKAKEAAAGYRALLAVTANIAPVLLGLERAYAEIGQTDTLLVVVDSVIRSRPRDPTARTIYLRALRMAGRADQSRGAFERWVREVPGDATPFREYARQLLGEGRTAEADTVLQRAQQALGGTRDLANEVASLRAALGLWVPSAEAWRAAIAQQDYLVQAAAFALQPTPSATRDAVRDVLRAPPVQPGARRILAALELGWGRPAEAWAALRDLPRNDATIGAWREFAEGAEQAEAWLPASQAYAAVLAAAPDPDVAERAAQTALNARDPRAALAIVDRALPTVDAERAGRTLLPVAVRALGELGRAAEAEQRLARAQGLDAAQRAALARQVAWGWVRAGDVARARRTLEAAGPAADSADVDEAETTGWMALYEGDLAGARASLRRSAESTPEHVLAMAILGRTRADRSAAAGAAFLDLARGDSLAAAARFVDAAGELPDAAPLLVASGARLLARRPEEAARLWRRVLAEFASAPEAAEADLVLARQALARRDTPAAVERLEHLILTYPQSALVPQARRELELARQTVPPA